MPRTPTLVASHDREGEVVGRRISTTDAALRSRVSDKKVSIVPIPPPQKQTAPQAQLEEDQVVLSPRTPKTPKTPKTPRSILNRQKQLAVSNRLSLNFAHDVMLMAHFLGGILAVVLAGYGVGAGLAAYTNSNNFLWANAGVAAILFGILVYSYYTIVRPLDYLINAGLSYVCVVQRAIVMAQGSAGNTQLSLPALKPGHPIAYLRKAYVSHLLHYVRLGLFTPPVLLFAAALAVLGTAIVHNRWYLWGIGSCFATMSSLWFIAAWTLYSWLQAKARRLSSQISAFFSEFLSKYQSQEQEPANVNADHPHVE